MLTRTTLVACLLALALTACAPAATPAPTAAPTSAPAATVAPTEPPAATAIPEKTKPANPTATVPPAAGQVLFTLTKPDGTTMDFTTEALKALPQGTVLLGSTPNEGPLLSEIIKAAGLTDYTEVTLTGSKGAETFKKTEITDQYILDFTNHGTLKPAYPGVAQPTKVGDVKTIVVK